MTETVVRIIRQDTNQPGNPPNLITIAETVTTSNLLAGHLYLLSYGKCAQGGFHRLTGFIYIYMHRNVKMDWNWYFAQNCEKQKI